MKVSRPARRTQRGLSIVEVMVAAALGLILLLVLIQIVVSNKDAHRWQQNRSVLQENGRFAVSKVAQVVRMTAYQGSTGAEWLRGPLSTANGGVVPLGGTNDDTNGSDTLVVAFQGSPDGFVKDCHGSTVAAGTVALNRFSISAGGDLQCAVSTNGGTSWNTLVVIPDVEAMHVLFGVDATADGSANRYVDATQVTNMERVVSVRIGLLMVSREDALVPVVDGNVYPVLDATVHAGSGPGDRRARLMLSTTVELRNHS